LTVEQRNVVDAIGIRTTDGAVVLTISDHLPFDGGAKRLLVLQDKLNDYLRFIKSGEIFDSYPAAHGRRVEVNIAFQHPPDDQGRQFLHAAEEVFRGAGLNLTFRVSTEE
jgi:hypothetical protein